MTDTVAVHVRPVADVNGAAQGKRGVKCTQPDPLQLMQRQKQAELLEAALRAYRNPKAPTR